MGDPPIAGWFTMENPIKMDDDWGYPNDSGNLHMFQRTMGELDNYGDVLRHGLSACVICQNVNI